MSGTYGSFHFEANRYPQFSIWLAVLAGGPDRQAVFTEDKRPLSSTSDIHSMVESDPACAQESFPD